MITVVCLKWGDKYSGEYVNRLYGMVRRNITMPFTFYCMTDDPEGFSNSIRVLRLPEFELHGWWYKLYLFNRDFYGLAGDVVFFDLDVVITGCIDDLVTYKPGKFCIAPSRLPRSYNSSVMRLEIGSMGYVWDSFIAQRDAVLSRFRGDQDWIQQVVVDGEIYPYPYVVSYKRDCEAYSRFSGGRVAEWLRGRGLFRPRREAIYPDGARVVLFHGKPDPEDVAEHSYGKFRRAGWIKDFWKP